MEGQTVKFRTNNLKKNFMAPFCGWVQLPQGQNSQVYSWNIHLNISKLTGKTEYVKHVVLNITFSKAAGQGNNITGQRTSAQVLFYLNVYLFATIVSIQGIWKVGGTGDTPTPILYQCLNFKKWYEIEICTRDIPCAMMAINNAIDYVK